MNVFSVAVFSLMACFAGVILKHFSHPIAPFVGIIAVLCILSVSMISLSPVIDFIKTIDKVERFNELYSVMLKGLGISVLSETASNICKDCGEASLASKVELASKVSILILSLPLLTSILELSKEMMLS